jgi:hypothetical protein
MTAPSLWAIEWVRWGLFALIAVILWASADYFFYRRRAPKSNPQATSTSQTSFAQPDLQLGATSMKKQSIDIVRVDEPWATAYLADGTQLRVKIVFDEVFRVLGEDGKPAFTPNGEPLYEANFKSAFAVRVS